MAGLDRSKPYATVFGDDQGRMFEQGGQFYRGDGSPWAEPAAPKAEGSAPAKAVPLSKRATVKPEPAAATADADDQLAAQLGGAA